MKPSHLFLAVLAVAVVAISVVESRRMCFYAYPNLRVDNTYWIRT